MTSTPGQGTTFEVYLPRSDRCSVAAGGPGEPSPTESARILFVDDEEPLAHLTGEDLGREVRRIRPDIPIILCTGFTPMMTAEQAATLGIDALCPKPLSLRDLGVAIRRVLAQRTTSRVEHENARGCTKGNV